MTIAPQQIDRILDELMEKMEADEGIVSIGVEQGGDDSDPLIVIGHLEPETFQHE